MKSRSVQSFIWFCTVLAALVSSTAQGAAAQNRLFIEGVTTSITPDAPEALQGQSSRQTRSVSWPERLNIVWISLEDLSARRLGTYGDPVAQTPNIDRLASQGMTFTNAFSTAGACAPSRSAIITGMYQNSIGTQHMRTTSLGVGLPTPYSAVPPPYVKTFTEYLRDVGYYTTNNGKTDYQFETPFTAWDENGSQAHWRSDQRKEGQPFFSVFNIFATHESRLWAENDEDGELTTDPSEVPVPPYLPDTEPVRREIARLYDNIAEADQQVGRILRQLEEDGLADETVVFLWGDHGDGVARAKHWLYDSGIHVPLIVRWPGTIGPSTVNEELVSLIDLGPTVLSIAGVDVPYYVQGQPFLGPDASGEGEREYVYAARDRGGRNYDMVRAVRDERFKYIRNYYQMQPYNMHTPYTNRKASMQALLRGHARGTLNTIQELFMRDSRPAEELYDIRRDPHEVHNLADKPKYQDVLERMRGAMDAWMERIDDMGDVAEDRMVADMYPSGEQPTTHAPYVVPRTTTESRKVSFQEEIHLNGTQEVVLNSPTPGASVAYTFESGKDPYWRLYTGPLMIERDTTIRVKAIRYGYKASEVQEVDVIE